MSPQLWLAKGKLERVSTRRSAILLINDISLASVIYFLIRIHLLLVRSILFQQEGIMEYYNVHHLLRNVNKISPHQRKWKKIWSPKLTGHVRLYGNGTPFFRWRSDGRYSPTTSNISFFLFQNQLKPNAWSPPQIISLFSFSEIRIYSTKRLISVTFSCNTFGIFINTP